MATTPVFACRSCGRPVAVTHLSSINDPNAEKLRSFMKHLADIAICPECRKKQLWLMAHGEPSEFRVNPNGVIYSVIDKSGLDYYGKNMK